MKRTVEFLVFVSVAVGLHVFLLWETEVGAPRAAGGITAAASAVTGATDDLDVLIDAWNHEPDVEAIDEMEMAEPEMNAPDTPTIADIEVSTTALAPPPASAPPQESPETMPTGADPVARPPIQTPLSSAPPPPSEPLATVPAPNAPALEIPLPMAAHGPALPSSSENEVEPRVAEPESDPNPRPDPGPKPPTTRAPPESSPVVSPPPDAGVALARPELPEVALQSASPSMELRHEAELETDTDLAPLVAVLPASKPARPEPVRPVTPVKPKAQVKKQKPVKQKPATAKPKAQPAVQAANTAPSQAGTTGPQDALSTAPVRGESGVSSTPAFSVAAVTTAKQGFLAKVRAAVLRKRKYPRRAERRRIEGTTKVKITLDAGGQLVAAQLAGSSGAGLLDDAAMDAVRRASGTYPSIPAEMQRNQVTITVPIRFATR